MSWMEGKRARLLLAHNKGDQALTRGVLARSVAAACGAVFLSAAATFGAEAREVCVLCQQPKASYRCKVPDVDLGRATAAAAKYTCITALAKHGGHSTCEIEQLQPGFSCLGELRVLTLSGEILDAEGTAAQSTGGTPEPDANSAASDNSAEKNGPEQPDDQATAKPPPHKKPPQTVEEFARETAKQSGESLKNAGQQIEKAGDAVQGAAKKTWDCITSLFSDC